MRRSADLPLAKPPRWESDRIDPYYWHFGTLAMLQMGGEWQVGWMAHLGAIVQHQRRDGFAGSWDPVGVWDEDGGRVCATAFDAIALEAAERRQLVAPGQVR